MINDRCKPDFENVSSMVLAHGQNVKRTLSSDSFATIPFDCSPLNMLTLTDGSILLRSKVISTDRGRSPLRPN